jgi:hypothetical protein
MQKGPRPSAREGRLETGRTPTLGRVRASTMSALSWSQAHREGPLTGGRSRREQGREQESEREMGRVESVEMDLGLVPRG